MIIASGNSADKEQKTQIRCRQLELKPKLSQRNLPASCCFALVNRPSPAACREDRRCMARANRERQCRWTPAKAERKGEFRNEDALREWARRSCVGCCWSGPVCSCPE